MSSLRDAAEKALHRGWYVFGVPANSKAAFPGSHGSKDADNSDLALKRWDTHPNEREMTRPCSGRGSVELWAQAGKLADRQSWPG